MFHRLEMGAEFVPGTPTFPELPEGGSPVTLSGMAMAVPLKPIHWKSSWVSAHPRFVIGFILVVCLGPFLNKAIHTDDALYVWTGQWIQHHPADFFGLKVNEWFSAIPIWKANWNPPMMSYYLAGVASLFGWNEIVLHLAGLVVAFAAAMGIYSLAQMWCDRPLLATVIAIVTPAFLVSSTTLMCDVPMLAFWVWSLVVWERALANEHGRWQFMGAGALAGLAVLTKYSAVTLLPLLLVLGVLRTRKLGWWCLGAVIPLIMVAGYEWLTAEMYGMGAFSTAVAHTQHSREFPGSLEARGIIGLAFAGGCLLPLLFFAPFLWRPKALLAGGIAVAGLWLAMFPLWDHLGLINSAMNGNPETFKHWYYLLQVALLTVGGLHLLLLVAVEGWCGRDINSAIIVLWIVGGLFSAIVLNFAVNARSFLLIVPPAAILLARRLSATRGSPVAGRWLLWPLIPSAAIALSLAVADYELANAGRKAVEKIMAKYKTTNRTVWFEGHGAFQYYMEKLGGQPIDVERSLLQPGDAVVVPEIGTFFPLPLGSVGWIEGFQCAPFSWMNLLGGTTSGVAGFYGANWGPVPFDFGKPPSQWYYIVKVFSQVQWNSKPTNLQDIQAGDVPDFPNLSFSMQKIPDFPLNSEAVTQVQLAIRYENEGKIEEAIQHYRNALDVDSNNPVIMNNLAWMLATTSKTELRNGEEAVRLAIKAAELSDWRQPFFIGTLAAAYAQAGQFPLACKMASIARNLAFVTGQKEIAASNEKLLSLYSSGKMVDATHVP
jgi:4-amino-4-deoxy-L-arabinose transferase-like glycosyltransferase